MANIPDKISAWQMVEPSVFDKETKTARPGTLAKKQIDVPELKSGEVLVEVAGCGVCHTDLGFFYQGVPTVSKPPMTLGHEISGTVVAGDEEWIGKEVIIPAVMPCRRCYLCKTGRGNRCLAQKMPGNSMGTYGGFASHIPVPSIDLCEIKDRAGIPLELFSVVADAATTPYQAIKRADFQPGDNTIVIGVGGVGQYIVQQLKALGAATVVAVDISEERLEKMKSFGADYTVNVKDKTPKDGAKQFKSLRKELGLPGFGWKIFEASGTIPGQELGLAVLSFTGKMIVVGFGVGSVDFSVSRLMAFDAEVIGTWGCLPEYYPVVLDMVLKNKIAIREFAQTRPMSRIKEAFEEAHHTPPDKRIVLVPDFE